EPLADLHAIAETIPEDHFATRDLPLLDDEHAVRAVAALHGGGGNRDRALDAIGRDLDARERAGLQLAVRVRHFALDREGARLQVHPRRDAHNLAGEHLLRERVDFHGHLAAGLD